MRFDIVFYEKHNRDQKIIERMCINDIRRKIDIVLIVEINLNITDFKRLAIELCRSVKASSRKKATI